MALRLVQYRDNGGHRAVAALDDDGRARRLEGVSSIYELASAALRGGVPLAAAIDPACSDHVVDIAELEAAGRLLAPIDHPDPAHVYLTGTGLTHLGSAEGRDRMHREASGGNVTDSMRMFLMGLDGGKPADCAEGVQPE